MLKFFFYLNLWVRYDQSKFCFRHRIAPQMKVNQAHMKMQMLHPHHPLLHRSTNHQLIHSRYPHFLIYQNRAKRYHITFLKICLMKTKPGDMFLQYMNCTSNYILSWKQTIWTQIRLLPRQIMWTQIRLLPWEQSDLGSYCLQCWLPKNITSVGSQNLVTLIFTKTAFCLRGNTKCIAHILSKVL